MNYSGVLLWCYWQGASLPFALVYACLSMILLVSADDCVKPFSMPVTNVALINGTHMRGVQVGVGSANQILAMVPSLCVDLHLVRYLVDKQQCIEQHARL